MTTRRDFVKTAGALLAVGATSAIMSDELHASPVKRAKKEDLFKVSMAGYTFLHFDIDRTIEMMKRINVNYLCIKDFHLPLNASQEQCDAFMTKLRNNGITGYAIGPIYMRNEEQVDQAFVNCRRLGLDLIVGVPNHNLLPYVERKVREYNFKYAIHIHGPDMPDLYPNAKDVIDHVKTLDARIGLCLDIGHNARDGFDPVADMKKYNKRIFDIHIKDVTAPTKAGATCEIGRGIVDIPAFVKMLRRVKYAGACSLEYEKDMRDPMAGLAESIGFFKGAMEAVK